MPKTNPYSSDLFKNYDEAFPPLNQASVQATIAPTKSKARRADIKHCHAILMRVDLHEESKISLLEKEFSDSVKNINSPIIQGDTLLHYAAKLGLTKVAKFLLDKGAIATKFNKKFYWPLHTAIAFGQLDTFKLLFDHSGDFVTPTRMDPKYRLEPLPTLLHIAVYHHQEEMVDFFLNNFDCKGLFKSRKANLLVTYCSAPDITNTNILKTLLAAGMRTNVIVHSDRSPLLYLLDRSWNPTNRYGISRKRHCSGGDINNMFLRPANTRKPKIFAAAKLLLAAGANPYCYCDRSEIFHPFFSGSYNSLMNKIPKGMKEYCEEPAFLTQRNNMHKQLVILQENLFWVLADSLSVQKAYEKYIPAQEANYALLNFFHEYLGRIFHFSMGWNKKEYYNTFITWLNKKRLTAPEAGAFKENGIATKEELDTLKELVDKMHCGEVKPYYFMQSICETLGIVKSCEKSLTMESVDTEDEKSMCLEYITESTLPKFRNR